MSKNQDELTGLECGLIKNNNGLKWENKGLKEKLDLRTTFIINLLKEDHTKLKEFYIAGDFWVKGLVMTELKEYTNKKGKKSMKHYVGNRYVSPQPKSDVPTLVNGWNVQITEKSINLFDIDKDGMLVANKERFEKFYL
tara:strand:+ start:95 stop:511 length:417 start_codon:yes stop_codon:yes gene_type:complete